MLKVDSADQTRSGGLRAYLDLVGRGLSGFSRNGVSAEEEARLPRALRFAFKLTWVVLRLGGPL